MAAIGGGTEEEATDLHQEPYSKKRKPDPVEMAWKKSEEIAKRYFKDLASRRPRFDVASEPPSSQFDVAQMPASQLSAYAQAQPGSQYAFQGSSKRMDIPNAKVGVIIGKGREIWVQSGARIHITDDTEPYSETRDVEIRGTSEQITKAEQLIKDVIAKTDAGWGSSFGSQGGDHFSMDLPVDKVALVIGQRGETIKNIRSTSGARILIIPLRCPPGDTSIERRVYIIGNKEQIDSAKKLVNEVISGNPSTPNTYPQQGYALPGNWGQPPMQQPGHGYAQSGSFALASPPYYSNYPQQPAAWDQSNPPAAHLPPQQNTGYSYYGQQASTEAGSAQPNASYGYEQQTPTEAGSAQSNASYGCEQQTPTEAGSAQSNASYGYEQQTPTEAGSAQSNASYGCEQQTPTEAGSAQSNASYGYEQQTPTEAGSAQPNASYFDFA